MAVTVSLLGELEARAGERAVPAPAHPQGPALLAWLALHPGEHDRGPLAALLWPERGAPAARAELRRAAWSLRRALAPHDRAVLDGRTTLGLRCTTDVEQFDAYVAAGDGAAALALCRRGPLLAGLEEHEWVLAARAEFARRVAALRAAAAREHGGSRGPCGGRPTP
jgi:DNA-binding SARP family transcriptional activator